MTRLSQLPVRKERLRMAKYVYPAVFHPNSDDGSITVTVPSLPGCITEGKDLTDAVYMAGDAVAMWLWCTEDQHEEIPEPAPPPDVKAPEFVSYVYADTDEYRRKFGSRAVKKTLSIPSWLNERAVQAGVNFSQILQDALKERLGLQEP